MTEYRYTVILTTDKITITNEREEVERLIQRFCEIGYNATNRIIDLVENSGSCYIECNDPDDYSEWGIIHNIWIYAEEMEEEG